jgi:hypothetical protein
VTEPLSAPSPTRRFFGALLMGIGGLMVLLCGGCGALFVIGGLVTLFTSNAQESLMIAGMGLFIGGIPAAIGAGLFMAGRNLRKPDAATFKVDKGVFDPDPPA